MQDLPLMLSEQALIMSHIVSWHHLLAKDAHYNYNKVNSTDSATQTE